MYNYLEETGDKDGLQRFIVELSEEIPTYRNAQLVCLNCPKPMWHEVTHLCRDCYGLSLLPDIEKGK